MIKTRETTKADQQRKLETKNLSYQDEIALNTGVFAISEEGKAIIARKKLLFWQDVNGELRAE